MSDLKLNIKRQSDAESSASRRGFVYLLKRERYGMQAIAAPPFWSRAALNSERHALKRLTWRAFCASTVLAGACLKTCCVLHITTPQLHPLRNLHDTGKSTSNELHQMNFCNSSDLLIKFEKRKFFRCYEELEPYTKLNFVIIHKQKIIKTTKQLINRHACLKNQFSVR